MDGVITGLTEIKESIIKYSGVKEISMTYYLGFDGIIIINIRGKIFGKTFTFEKSILDFYTLSDKDEIFQDILEEFVFKARDGKFVSDKENEK